MNDAIMPQSVANAGMNTTAAGGQASRIEHLQENTSGALAWVFERECVMIRILAIAAILLCGGVAMCEKETGAPAPDPQPYYVKVEVKGDLFVNDFAKFDPDARIRRGERTGTQVIVAGGRWADMSS